MRLFFVIFDLDFFELSPSSTSSTGSDNDASGSTYSTWLRISCTTASSSRPFTLVLLLGSFSLSGSSSSSLNSPGILRSLEPGGDSRRRYLESLMIIDGSKPASSAVAAKVAANSMSLPKDEELFPPAAPLGGDFRLWSETVSSRALDWSASLPCSGAD